MKVANIIEDGRLAGPQARISAVAGALKGRVETVVVMPSNNSPVFRNRCDELGVAYKTLPLSHITKDVKAAIRYVLCSPVEIIVLARFLAKGDFDVVHVSGGAWQFKGVIAARLARVKSLWHLNDTAMPGFIRRLFGLLSGLANGYIYASEASKRYYKPLVDVQKSSFVIPAPVNTGKVSPECQFDGDESTIAAWQGKTVIGMVANVSPVKGIETFIRAAGAAITQRDDLQFVVVGPVSDHQRPYYERLQSLCREQGVSNIEFVGAREDVRPLLKRFDLYLCTSVAESSPMAVWEAMSMATPIVSTDVGDVPLYVKPGSNGFVEAVGDWQSLAQDVLALADDPAMRQAYGKEARRVAVEQLDIQRCADLHYQAYSQLLDS